MYRVPPFRPRLYLLRIDGTRREFEHVEAAARQLTSAFRRDEVGLDFGIRYERRWPPGSRLVAILVDYILRDELGDPVDPAEVLPLRRRLAPRRHHWSWRRSGKWCGWRTPRTTAERRLNALVLEEEGEPVRCAKRRPSNLPSLWDDRHRNGGRNWKRYRNTNWRSTRAAATGRPVKKLLSPSRARERCDQGL